MTPEEKTLVQQTWCRVVPIADTAARLFYDRLFQLDPAIGRLFADVDMARQHKRLIEALDKVIAALDQLEELVPAIRAMGRRHAAYGVEDRHYDAVGAALLWTLEQGLGETWTEESRAAWAQAFETVAGAMRSGAAEAPPAPANPCPETVH